MDLFIDIIAKIGFATSLCSSAYFAYIHEYDGATLFAVWSIIMLILVINNDDGEDEFYV